MSKLTPFALHLDKLLVILIKWRVMEHFMNEETKNSDNAKQVTEAVKVIEKDIFSRHPSLKVSYEDEIKRVVVLLTSKADIDSGKVQLSKEAEEYIKSLEEKEKQE